MKYNDGICKFIFILDIRRLEESQSSLKLEVPNEWSRMGSP